MNPKDKAIELYEKCYIFASGITPTTLKDNTKASVLIIINEITRENLVLDLGGSNDFQTIEKLTERYNYWKEVKLELENL